LCDGKIRSWRGYSDSAAIATAHSVRPLGRNYIIFPL
jgi:hypothetical protein